MVSWNRLTTPKKVPKIAVIGAGNMGKSIIAGLLKSGVYHPDDIKVHEIIEKSCEYITKTYKVECLKDVKKAVEFADICLLAVKPSDLAKVLEQLCPNMKSEKLLVSIVAGVALDFYRKNLPKHVPVFRVMPNIAVQVREGMIMLSYSENVTTEQVKTVTNMWSLLGSVMTLDEKYLNLATGLVGSGTAYIYLIIDSLADAGVRLGLSKDVSTLLAAQTTLGAGKMVVETGEHPAILKDMVVSPAGTTIEGLLELERCGFRAVLISAVTKAAERATKLAQT
jgi:pyrroline-5-carboxylate reductase